MGQVFLEIKSCNCTRGDVKIQFLHLKNSALSLFVLSAEISCLSEYPYYPTPLTDGAKGFL